MKIQVLSDIHGSYASLKSAIDNFKSYNPDIYLICGDFLNHGPRNPLPDGHDTRLCAALLNEIGQKVICVRGNCDSEVDQMVLNFPCLAPYTSLFVTPHSKANGRIFAHHGHLLDEDEIKKLLPKGTLIVSGHTHVTVLEEKDGYWWFNPGSISLPKCDDGKTCGLINVDEKGIESISLYTIEGDLLKTLSVR